MSQYKLTEAGLRFKGNEEALQELIVALNNFRRTTNGKEYEELIEKTNKFFSSNYDTVYDLLQMQVEDTKLSTKGWNYLTNLVKYLIINKHYDRKDIRKGKELDKVRDSLGKYFNVKTFLNKEELSTEEIKEMRTSRSTSLFALGKDVAPYGASESEESISTEKVFVRGLYTDRPLLVETLKLLLMNK